jgi:hypothetical protein
MSASGSFGVNYKKVYATTDALGLPAIPMDRGSDKVGEFMFIKAGAAIAQYAWVGIDGEGDALELTTTTYASSAAIGVAQVDIASGEYAWVFVGKGGGTGSGIKALFSANYAACAVVNTTATAGVADDSATKILGGVVGLTLVGGAQASAEIMASGLITKVTA